jgi:CDP-diacylglycerol pyrophosphatase
MLYLSAILLLFNACTAEFEKAGQFLFTGMTNNPYLYLYNPLVHISGSFSFKEIRSRIKT